MRNLTVDRQRYLPGNRSSAHLSPIGPHLYCFAKPLTCTEDDNAHHKHYLVSVFCILSPAQLPQYAHVLRLQTFTPESSAKHLWKMPQDTWHSTQIWKSGHRGYPWHPGLNSLGSHVTGPPCARGRQWFIQWILWGHWHLLLLAWLTRAVPTA